MIFDSGVTSQSIDIQIVDDTGLPVTGLLAATFPTLKYSRAGANSDVAFPAPTDLATITTAYAAGGVKERGEGVYRLDVPDAIFASAGRIKIRGEASGKHVIVDTIEVSPVVHLAGDLTSTMKASVTAAVPSVEAIVEAVWDAIITGSTAAGTILAALAGYLASYVAPLDAAGTRSALGLASADLDDQLDAILEASSGTADPAAIAEAVLTTPMTESYAAEGEEPTLTEAIMLLHQKASNASVAGGTMTVKKLDGSTTAAAFTLTGSPDPTAIARSE
ncbi:hypothetical protein [Schlesneria sp. T3-172]|uniref:hypothetical protein n=1 Tax=Schlesneria sphaerica TaxID=3373610 RepID=UPI0037CCAD32